VITDWPDVDEADLERVGRKGRTGGKRGGKTDGSRESAQQGTPWFLLHELTLLFVVIREP